MYPLDALDKQILTILQRDGRTTHVEIGRLLNTSHTRIRDRVQRMEKAGVITGYRAVIDPSLLGYAIQCLVHVQVDQQADFEQFVQQLLELDEVVEVVNITGEFDVIVRIWARDFKHLRDFLYNKISAFPAHKQTVSNIILGDWFKPFIITLA
jgi:DNA-binding Lrp family transcriptional regulator